MKKSETRKMIRKLIMEISSNTGSYKADEGEPDTGWLAGGKKRKLGMKYGKPEPWFDQGGYTQLLFPEADHIFGKKGKPEFSVKKKAQVKTLKTTEKELKKNKDIEALGKIIFEKQLKKSELRQMVREMIAETNEGKAAEGE